jgi:ubiquinone/menaquinone biosynthesis C-methylase UbiE
VSRPTASREPFYVCGHAPEELARLESQAQFFEAITRRILTSAGVGRGMHVLDIGCGAGDVSLLVAEMVGRAGRVLGIDRAAPAVAAATARASARGLAHVAFEQSHVDALSSPHTFDAVVGRFVLMHQADPGRALERAARHLREGGLVAMIESHMQAAVTGPTSYPPVATYDRLMRWIRDVIDAAGAHADAGLGLAHTFAAAGLPPPTMTMEARVSSGSGTPVAARYIVESVRSMKPMAEALGVVIPDDGDLDTLCPMIERETACLNAVLVSPLIVGAWCRVGQPGL